ncbi:MAG: DUF2804 domain-containing protein [Clostridia bacterium]|nr:DUF2804 domain-containing protein [Clostridia bacterium]
MAQHRLSPGPLHDEQGRLAEAGYATALVKTYDRRRIAANPLRIKEWDYYCVTSDRYALALTIADNGYMAMDSISLLDFDENSQCTYSRIGLFPLGRRHLPATSERGDIRVKGKDYEMTFENDGVTRHLWGRMERCAGGKPLLFDVTLSQPPRDSMVIATPFPGKPKAFYYNQKINCLRAQGKVISNGKEYLFAPAHSFAVLDWGRGVWTYDNTWYWGSASGLAGDVPFGFNIGYGFGDTSAASENMVFYHGQAHKLSRVTFHIPMKNGTEDYLSPWRFTSDDGRFEMDFTPLMDRSANMDFQVLCSKQHQVFGRFTGHAILDDGRAVTVRNLTGFAEKVRNKW